MTATEEPSSNRYDRFYSLLEKKDTRSAGQRDRDRVLHSQHLLRLDGVTQVVSPTEQHVFHNRYTHSFKVAQIARRIAERLLSQNEELCQKLGGINPDVVEAAALAHDLGHPPFGHVAEKALNQLVAEEQNIYDGFAYTARNDPG